ncbi:unnamed protein product, partial [marine sediment metagenome]
FLEEFKKTGMISLEGNKMKLLDTEKLNSLAEHLG